MESSHSSVILGIPSGPPIQNPPTSDYVLEILNLFYTGYIEQETWIKHLTGTTRSGLILRDVSLEVHSGEIMAILGSNGSGKKALLDVISARIDSSGINTTGSKSRGKANTTRENSRGYVLLNGVTVNRRLFNKIGSYLDGVRSVTDDPSLFVNEGLTVGQVLHYEASLSLYNFPSSLRALRVRQILADVALTQLVDENVENLSTENSERRRLLIGIKLIKDPVIFLADEPACGHDPLNTYFIISILSNYAKKYGRIIILTMDRPRSDIFPFLSRVTYLCLGDIVYSGYTRQMLDYFREIGFPCPELENPLMYYLCLATVDRRSQEKFLESTNQISLLVEKFKHYYYQQQQNGESNFGLSGGNRRQFFNHSNTTVPALSLQQQDELLLGKAKNKRTDGCCAGFFTKLGIIILRNYASIFQPFTCRGMHNIFFRLLFLPLLFFIYWIFYFGATRSYQHNYVTYNGIVLNAMVVIYFSSIISTILTFEWDRSRYYIESSREGQYSGSLFILATTISSVPFTLITCLIGSRIFFECLSVSGANSATAEWLLICCVFIACYSLAQQQTYGLMLTVKSHLGVAAMLLGFHGFTLALASCTVKALRSLPQWLYYLTFIVQGRYAGGFLNQMVFQELGLFDFVYNRTVSNFEPLKALKLIQNGDGEGQTQMISCALSDFGNNGGLCRYVNGTHYLRERYYYSGNGSSFGLVGSGYNFFSSSSTGGLNLMQNDLDYYMNFLLCFTFPIGTFLVNLLTYEMPLPLIVKKKFRGD